MKICIVSKFPPIEGGIAAKTYWLAKGLAEAGLEVHVVTNALAVEDDYRIKMDNYGNDLPPGVFVHNVKTETPWHIPYSPLYLDKLLDKVLEICREYSIDLLDSNYLVPYGTTAYLASTLTGIPYIIRHGGSDIIKFWEAQQLPELLHRTIAGASAVVTENPELARYNPNCVDMARYVADERYFKPSTINRNEPTYAFIGKINYYWHYRGLEKILSFYREHAHNSKLLFMAQGRGKKTFIRECKPNEVTFLDFILPWEIPLFLQQVDYLFYPVKDNPIKDFANIVVEAVACGASILTDDLSSFDCYQTSFNVPHHVFLMDDFKQENVAKIKNDCLLTTNFADYLEQNIHLYKKILKI